MHLPTPPSQLRPRRSEHAASITLHRKGTQQTSILLRKRRTPHGLHGIEHRPQRISHSAMRFPKQASHARWLVTHRTMHLPPTSMTRNKHLPFGPQLRILLQKPLHHHTNSLLSFTWRTYHRRDRWLNWFRSLTWKVCWPASSKDRLISCRFTPKRIHLSRRSKPNRWALWHHEGTMLRTNVLDGSLPRIRGLFRCVL